LAPVVAQAAPSAQEICMAGLLKAKAKYEKCVADWMSKEYGGKAPDQDKSVAKLAKKCRIKYAAEWTKLSSSPKLAGTTCDQARYEDNGNGTVTDHLTSLTWEKKSDDGGIHDKDNSYTWSTGALQRRRRGVHDVPDRWPEHARIRGSERLAAAHLHGIEHDPPAAGIPLRDESVRTIGV
jgi:hypothetical protein